MSLKKQIARLAITTMALGAAACRVLNFSS
jgi:hypothetical protein